MPRLSTFVTLSPAPGFAQWLKAQRAVKTSLTATTASKVRADSRELF